MSVFPPLGVRIFNKSWDYDEVLTKYVEDLSFRSVIPGGFASATIRLHRVRMASYLDSRGFGSDLTALDAYARLFNRVQIFDLRSAEIVWEGRVEDPRRSEDNATWELAALGAMVVASDIQRPVIYIDSMVSSWTTIEQDFLQTSANEGNKVIETRWGGGLTWPANTQYNVAEYRVLDAVGMYLARYDITLFGVAPAGTGDAAPTHLWNVVVLADHDGVTEGSNGSIEATNYTQNLRHTRRVGAAVSKFAISAGFVSTDATKIMLRTGVGGDGQAFGSYASAADKVIGRYGTPRIQPQRQNRYGNTLVTSGDYPNAYVTTQNIVEDVCGRFLVGGWPHGMPIFTTWGEPFNGEVRPTDAHIDTVNVKTYTDLGWPDGTTAEQILAELMAVHPDNYWAIWESRRGAQTGTMFLQSSEPTGDGVRDAAQWSHGFRFEWATWPDGYGYAATSIDGFEEQSGGETLANYVFYRYETDAEFDTGAGVKHLLDSIEILAQTGPESTYAPDLFNADLTRAITVIRENAVADATATAESDTVRLQYRKRSLAGTLTVRRPILFYDTGADNWSGAGRYVDPHQIRPGKLIRITDILPKGQIFAADHGTTAPPIEHEGTIFRVVATEYSSADNTAKLELDQVTVWSVANQIAGQAAKPTSVVKAVV